VFFLAVLARHAELPAVDGDVDLRHPCSRSIRSSASSVGVDFSLSLVARYLSSASTPRIVSIA
jgi:hypothetical protein